jgi:DNA modification methylase
VSYQLYLGDCLDYMRTMPDKSVDMVYTSPPFKDEDVVGEYWELYGQWMDEILRITSKVAIIINSANRLNKIISTWPPKRTMIWGKGVSQYSWRWNPIFVYQISDEYKVNKYIWCDTFGVESITGKWKVHKYQDPELLYETIIKMFEGCLSVLDPFEGSGTTALVCQRLGLQFIGCEIDPVSYEITEERIKQAAAQMLLPLT